jgi:HEAT repeat protein
LESTNVDVAQFRRIDPVCDAFEAELRAGKRPAIEEQLPLVPEEDREQLREELLLLEEYYLNLKGEQEKVSDGTPGAGAGPSTAAVTDTVSSSAGQRIEAVRTRFEEAWQAGTPPRIEDYLVGWEGAARAALLRELVRLDRAFRDQAGTPIALSEYRQRFPDLNPDETTHKDPGDDRPTGTEPVDAPPGYELLGVLGRGGMGVVYRARSPYESRYVALKMMRPELAKDPAARARFLREARALSEVEHDHVVRVYHVGEVGGVPYFVMPLLRGRTLAAYLAEYLPAQCLPPLAEVVRIGQEIAAGLAAVHDRGLVHRDIKPQNVWLEEPTGRVVVLDFGLVRPVDGAGQLTPTAAALGTPPYMSPEQFGGGSVDGRSDLFSLGTLLYLMTTGRLPFPATAVGELYRQITRHRPPAAAAVNPAVPTALSDLIEELHAKSPEARPSSAAEVERRLRAIEPDRPALPRQERRPDERVLFGVVDGALLIRPRPVRRRGKRIHVGVVAGALLLLAGGIWVLCAWLGARSISGAGEATPPESKTAPKVDLDKALDRTALPSILRLLEDKDALTAQFARDALQKIGPLSAEDLPLLLAVLDKPDGKNRQAVVRTLGRMDAKALDRTALPSILRLLEDKDALTAQFARDALQKIGPLSAEDLPLLLAVLDKPDGKNRQVVVRTLGRMEAKAHKALPRLVKLLAVADDVFQADVARTLDQLGPVTPEDVPLLLPALEGSEPKARGFALRALIKVKAVEPTAQPGLLTCLRDPDPAVRQDALTVLVSLSNLEKTGLVGSLCGVIRAEQKEGLLKRELTFLMARDFGEEGDREQIRRLQKDSRFLIQITAACILTRFKEETVAQGTLAKAFFATDPIQRQQVRDLAGSLPEASLLLLGALSVEKIPTILTDLEATTEKDEGRHVSLLLLRGMGKEGASARGRLLKWVRDTPMPPEHSIDGLKTLLAIAPTDRETRHLLVTAFEGAEAVQQFAVATLAEQGKEVVPLLIDALNYKSYKIRLNTLRTLGRIGPDAKAALVPLAPFTLDPDPTIKEAANVAFLHLQPRKP